MKKRIAIITLILIAGIVTVNAQCCHKKASCETSNKTLCSEQKANTEVKAYYFHTTRRCASCEAVETVAKETLKENYGEKVIFHAINREKEKDNPLLKKYKVNGQSLLVVKGEKVINLTNDAFLYARTSPAIFKKKIKSAIDPLI